MKILGNTKCKGKDKYDHCTLSISLSCLWYCTTVVQNATIEKTVKCTQNHSVLFLATAYESTFISKFYLKKGETNFNCLKSEKT